MSLLNPTPTEVEELIACLRVELAEFDAKSRVMIDRLQAYADDAGEAREAYLEQRDDLIRDWERHRQPFLRQLEAIIIAAAKAFPAPMPMFLFDRPTSPPKSTR